MGRSRPSRCERLFRVLGEYQDILVVTHNNPDPDAIASGWALLVLVRKCLRKPARLIGRGPILRAENLYFLKLLHPPIELMEEIQVGTHTAAILVDCAPGSMNHLLAGVVDPIAVIDHHEIQDARIRIPFRDIRPRVAASASITATYLREQGIEPSRDLATALLYAIRTELRGSKATLTRVDHAVLAWLTAFGNHDVLEDIENAPLPRFYFEELLLALKNVFLYADSAICFLPRVAGIEIVGEVADLLIRCEGVNRVLCGGKAGEDFVVSARTKGKGGDAVTLLRSVLSELGHFGGHRHRAGGRIVDLREQPIADDDIESELRKRWLGACGIKQHRGTRLVARKEIAQDL